MDTGGQDVVPARPAEPVVEFRRPEFRERANTSQAESTSPVLPARRTAVGPYGLDAARTLDELADRFEVLPIAAAARAALAAVDLDDQAAGDVRVGRSLDLALTGLSAVFAPDGEFLALYEPRGGSARAVAVFV